MAEAEATAIFKQIDVDSSGSLDMREMHNKLSDFGLGEAQIEQIFFGALCAQLFFSGVRVHGEVRCASGRWLAHTPPAQFSAVLDTNNDGEISMDEFIAGFDKFCSIRDGGAADFNSGPVQQWGFQKWKLDRWLAFDGEVISVYKCSGHPEAGVTPHFTLPMDVSVCFKDPTNEKRFSIDTGTAMVHFRCVHLLRHEPTWWWR